VIRVVEVFSPGIFGGKLELNFVPLFGPIAPDAVDLASRRQSDPKDGVTGHG
jgi:hypothetical protein